MTAPEESPLDYVEARATRTSLDPTLGGHVLNLTVIVPQTVQHHRTPGSQARALERLMSLATAPGHSLRISVVSDAHKIAEFNRMEPDGTMRDLLPLEGTW